MSADNGDELARIIAKHREDVAVAKAAAEQRARNDENARHGCDAPLRGIAMPVLREWSKRLSAEISVELHASEQSVYRWIYQYSRYLKKNRIMVVEDKSESYRTKELEKRLKEAEAALGRKQMEIDFLNKLIEFADEEFKIDVKKNLSKGPLPGSKSGKGKNTSTK